MRSTVGMQGGEMGSQGGVDERGAGDYRHRLRFEGEWIRLEGEGSRLRCEGEEGPLATMVAREN